MLITRQFYRGFHRVDLVPWGTPRISHPVPPEFPSTPFAIELNAITHPLCQTLHRKGYLPCGGLRKIEGRLRNHSGQVKYGRLFELQRGALEDIKVYCEVGEWRGLWTRRSLLLEVCSCSTLEIGGLGPKFWKLGILRVGSSEAQIFGSRNLGCRDLWI